MKAKNNKRFSIKNIAMMLFLALLLTYGLTGTNNLRNGPKLTLYYPADNVSFSEKQLVQINGQTKRAIAVKINGRELPLSQDGYFTDSLLLQPNYNIILITATDRFGKEHTKKMTFLYQQPEATFES